MAASARRVLAAVALCALAAGITATSAVAHAGSPDYESLVRGVSPQIPGFKVEVLNGDDRLAVENSGTRTVTIYGYNRRPQDPYIRMSPGGKVEVNLRSPAYYLNQDRFSGAKVPASADPKAPPSWKVVERNGRYEFHDHRMHWMSKTVPPQVKDKAATSKLTLKATVLSVGTLSVKEHHALVLVFVNSFTTTEGSKKQQVQQSRLVMDLTRTDGDWIVSDMDTI